MAGFKATLPKVVIATAAVLIIASVAWLRPHRGMGSAPPPYDDAEITAELSGPPRFDGNRVPDLRLTLTNNGIRPLRVLNPECDVVPEESARLSITREGRPVKRTNCGGGALFCPYETPRDRFEEDTTLLPAGARRDFPCRIVHREGSRLYSFCWEGSSCFPTEDRIPPGHYRLSVHYEVDDEIIAARFCQDRTVTAKFDHIWTGKTDSNTIDLRVR